MTKRELLELLKDCSDDARVTVVDPLGLVRDATVYYGKAVPGFRDQDEIFFSDAL